MGIKPDGKLIVWHSLDSNVSRLVMIYNSAVKAKESYGRYLPHRTSNRPGIWATLTVVLWFACLWVIGNFWPEITSRWLSGLLAVGCGTVVIAALYLIAGLLYTQYKFWLPRTAEKLEACSGQWLEKDEPFLGRLERELVTQFSDWPAWNRWDRVHGIMRHTIYDELLSALQKLGEDRRNPESPALTEAIQSLAATAAEKERARKSKTAQVVDKFGRPGTGNLPEDDQAPAADTTAQAQTAEVKDAQDAAAAEKEE